MDETGKIAAGRKEDKGVPYSYLDSVETKKAEGATFMNALNLPIMDRSVGADFLQGEALQKEKNRRELVKQIKEEISALVGPLKEEAKKKALRGENRDASFDKALGKLSTAFFESAGEADYPELLGKSEVLQERMLNFFRDGQSIGKLVNKTFEKIVTNAAENAIKEKGEKIGPEGSLDSSKPELPKPGESAEEKEQRIIEELKKKFGNNPVYFDEEENIYKVVFDAYDLDKKTFRVFIRYRTTSKEVKQRWSEEELELKLQNKEIHAEGSGKEKEDREAYENSKKEIIFGKFPDMVRKWKEGRVIRVKLKKANLDEIVRPTVMIKDYHDFLRGTDVNEEANKIFEDAIREIVEATKGEMANEKTPELTPEEKDKEREIARAGSQITLSRIKNWDEINAQTQQEGDEKFLQKTRELWKGFAVHGNLQRNEKTGERTLTNYADLDGKCALGLLELAGINTKDIKYVKQGYYEEGRINLDTGDRDGVVAGIEDKTAFIDHHGEQSKSDTSTAKKTYELLVSLGLLQKTEYLDNLVKFVNQIDNADYPGVEKYFENSWKTIAGLNRFCDFKTLKIFFEKDKNPDPTRDLSEGELKKYGFIYTRKGKEVKNNSERQKAIAEKASKALPEMERDGFIIQSYKYGKIGVEVNSGFDRNNPGGYVAAKAYGCNAYVIWNADSRSFFISTDRELQEEFSQGKKVRDRMWIKPMHDKGELTITLKEILNKMTDGKLTPAGKLKEYLENPEKYMKAAEAKEPTEYELGEEGDWHGEKKKEEEKLPELGREGDWHGVGKAAESGEKKKDGGELEKERKERLGKIEGELIRARKDYLEMEYKKKSSYSKLKNFFGTMFSDRRYERLGEEDQDIAYYKKEYDKKLLEHKTFLLEEAVGKGIAGEKLGEKLKTIVLEENIALEDTEVEVRVENFEGRYAGFVKESVKDMSERWEKLHWAEKTGIVVSVLGMATIAVGTGGAVAIGIGAAMLKSIIKSEKIPQFFKKTKEAAAEYYNHTLPVVELENNLKLDPRIQESNKELAWLNQRIPKAQEEEDLDRLVKRKQFLENQKELLSYINNVVSIRSYIAGKNKKEWDGIAKKPIGKLLKTGRGVKTAQNEGSLEGRISKIHDNLKNIDGFKEKLNPLNEKETVDDWVRRLARIARKGEIGRI
ncbi:MAG: hypothetical protein AAB487_01600 [Patescibacteria group bacterium]